MEKAVRIVFEGRVQGVGFRATAADLARKAGVKGWVRNNSDGSVECEAEGTDASIDLFLQTLLNRMSRYISSHHVTSLPSKSGFDAFTVRY